MSRFPTLPASRRSFLARSAGVLFAGGVVPLLAACGSSSSATTSVTASAVASTSGGATVGSGATAAKQAGSSTSAAPVSQAAAGQAAQGSVTWLVPEDPLLDKFSRTGIVPDFKKAQPNINVQVVSPGSTAYGEKLLALVAAGTTPEVFTDWGNIGIFTLQSHQIVTDLSTYINQAKIDLSFLLPSYVTEYSANGGLYAVPWNSNPNFIVYNKTLFQKYNVALPPTDWSDKTWTTDKMLAAAQTLTHATGDPSTSTFGLIMGAGSIGSLGWLWNADPFNNTGGPEASTVYQGQPYGQVYPDRQGMVDAMTWLADLTLKQKVSPTPTDTKAFSTQGNPIFSGRVGMAAPSVAAGGSATRRRSLQRERTLWFYLFIAPWLIGFLCFTVYPVIASFYFSFTQYNVTQAPIWIGAANYGNLIHDSLFWHSLAITGIYAIVSVPLNLLLAFCCALLLNVRLPFMRVLRTIYYLPTVLPVAATSVLWLFLFLPEFGIVDWVIHSLTGRAGPDWLGDPQWVLPALILMSVWGIGSAMVIFLAGLQAIPPELYEAAQLDGAGLFARARSVTFPMVTPVLLLNLILGLIGASQTFTQPYILTQGGPDYASYFYSLYLYQNAFEYFKLGLASAQAWILFGLVLICTVTVFRSSARWVYYGGERS